MWCLPNPAECAARPSWMLVSVSFLTCKVTPHLFPLCPLSHACPCFQIKKRERTEEPSQASPFDPSAMLSSVFSIQPIWMRISEVHCPSVRTDKSPPANCSHINFKRGIKKDTPVLSS